MKLRSAQQTARGAAGFTLIEVVLAMGLFLIGATAILGFLTFGAALSRTAGLRTLSAEAVEAVVADLEEGLFPLLEDGTAGEAEVITDRVVPGYPELSYSVQAIEQNADDGDTSSSPEVRVDVEIRWKGGVSRRGRRFSVLLLREAPFDARMRRLLRESSRSDSAVDHAVDQTNQTNAPTPVE